MMQLDLKIRAGRKKEEIFLQIVDVLFARVWRCLSKFLTLPFLTNSALSLGRPRRSIEKNIATSDDEKIRFHSNKTWQSGGGRLTVK
jgi:hypothetical protein